MALSLNSPRLAWLPASTHMVPLGCGAVAASVSFGAGSLSTGISAAVAERREGDEAWPAHAGNARAADSRVTATVVRRRVILFMDAFQFVAGRNERGAPAARGREYRRCSPGATAPDRDGQPACPQQEQRRRQDSLAQQRHAGGRTGRPLDGNGGREDGESGSAEADLVHVPVEIHGMVIHEAPAVPPHDDVGTGERRRGGVQLEWLAEGAPIGEPFRWTWMPTPLMASKPGKPASPMALTFGAVTVICTGTGNAPGGTTILSRKPSTRTGPIVPPAGPIVTLVTTAEKPPGTGGTGGGGGP